MIDWSDAVTQALEKADVPYEEDQTVNAAEKVELQGLRDYVNTLLTTGKW